MSTTRKTRKYYAVWSEVSQPGNHELYDISQEKVNVLYVTTTATAHSDYH